MHSGLILFASYLFSPIYAIFVNNIAGNIETVGFAYALFSISTAVLLLLISKWEDHIKHRENLLILSSGIIFIGYFAYLFVNDIIGLFAVQIILGVGTAIGLPAFDALYSKNLDQGKYASEWGIWESMNYLTAAFAASLGGVIAALFGFIVLFTMMALLALASLLMGVVLKWSKE